MKMLRNMFYVVFFTAVILIIPFTLNGCSSEPNVSEDGYIEVVSLTGDENMESKYFTVTNTENRLVVVTTNNNSDGIKGHFIMNNGDIHNPFNIGDNPIDRTWSYNLPKGDFKMVVESTGTEFKIRLEEKYIKKN